MAKKITPHIVIIALFAVIALAFFYPVLQGKGIFQSDIAQYTGMAEERNDYRQTENKETVLPCPPQPLTPSHARRATYTVPSPVGEG